MVGLFTFGLGGLVAGAALGAGAGALINEAEDRVKNAKNHVSNGKDGKIKPSTSTAEGDIQVFAMSSETTMSELIPSQWMTLTTMTLTTLHS